MFRTVLFVLAFPFQVAAATLSGVVLDPQNLPVPDVRVELTCDDRADSAKTDRRGQFIFTPDPAASTNCRISVARTGFAPVDQPLAADERPITIRLRIAEVTAAVDVRATVASSPDPSSTSLVETDFRTLAPDTPALIQYARFFAGASTLPSVVYVDGLPATTLPPIEMVASLSVNADPFSAEYADGDMTAIRITTRAPARTFKFNGGGDFLSLGGREVLAAAGRSESGSWNLGIRGPVPKTPVTFWLNAARSHYTTVSAIQAVLPASEEPSEVTSVSAVNRSGTDALDVYYSPSANRTATVSFRQSSGRASNQGVGGLTLPETGTADTFQSRELRATWRLVARGLAYEAGAVATRTASTTRANTAGLQISVPGGFTRGGAFISAIDSQRLRWTVRQVLRFNSKRPWTAGVGLSGTDYIDRQQPNTAGLIQFESLEAYEAGREAQGLGTLFVTRGDGAVDLSTLIVAPFVEKVLAQSARLQVRGGVRADHQSGFGTLLSPRIWLAARLRSFDVSAGAGLFVRSIPERVLVNAVTHH